MRLTCALGCSVLVACGGRIDRAGSGGSDASAMQQIRETPDATAAPDAGASTIDEAGAAACYIAPWSAKLPTPECGVALPPTSPCGASAYRVACAVSGSYTPPADGCVSVPNFGGFDVCCPCLGADAAAWCTDVDVSTYDRSCRRDSDCIVIQGGMMCTGECACSVGSGTAVNVDGRARYEQTTAPLLPLLEDCNCAAVSASKPVCAQGVCTLEPFGNP
ncbi:MAG TPA: hypothetical protein VMI75_12850 [Polyangiaceae bacterium]|nr:hypothetical protein [Polyangiaceae bacterium]